MKRSAGVLVYKKDNNDFKVFLAHMGGPYWENINEGGWSIPKGELDGNENSKKAALREFQEETNISLKPNNLHFLKTKKVSNNKLVIMFTTEQDLDNSHFKSNFFEKEWPKNSGIVKQFPEMDRADWFTISEAKKLIVRNQIYFLEKLEEKLKRMN